MGSLKLFRFMSAMRGPVWGGGGWGLVIPYPLNSGGSCPLSLKLPRHKITYLLNLVTDGNFNV